MSSDRDRDDTGSRNSQMESTASSRDDGSLSSHDETAAGSGLVQLPSSTVDEADIPRTVDLAGSIGIALGAIAIVLAVVGLLAAWLRIQPLGNMAILFSLVSIGIAMLLGMLFQAYAFDWSSVRN